MVRSKMLVLAGTFGVTAVLGGKLVMRYCAPPPVCVPNASIPVAASPMVGIVVTTGGIGPVGPGDLRTLTSVPDIHRAVRCECDTRIGRFGVSWHRR